MNVHEEPLAARPAAAASPVDLPVRSASAPWPWPYLVTAALALVLDQLSKWWAVAALTRIGREGARTGGGLAASWRAFGAALHPVAEGRLTVVENFFHLRYVENPGAAWGLLARTEAAWRTPLLALVAVVATLFALTSLWRARPEQRALRLGLGLLIGGALGNLLDRMRLGYVIDFIDWHWYDVVAWPTFNVADACISVGAGLLLVDFIAESRAAARASGSPGSAVAAGR